MDIGPFGGLLGTLLFLAAVLYFLDYIKWLHKFPVLSEFSGRIPRNPILFIVAICVGLMGLGIVSVASVSGGISGISDIGLPTASADNTQYSGDASLIMSNASAAFADTDYSFYALDYSTYTGQTWQEIYQDVIDHGTGDLVGAGGGVATPLTLSSGKYTIDDYTGAIGDKIILFGYDDTAPATTDSEVFLSEIELMSFNTETATWAVTPNRFTIYPLNSGDTYNFAATDIAGYVEDQDSATAGMTIDYDIYSTADGAVLLDGGFYAELPSTMQSRINKITISTDDGIFAEYTSFLDTANMDTSNPIFESAPAKQSSSNNLYYVGALPDSLRTSSTAKDKINVEIDYDHPGTGTNVCYFQAVWYVNGGGDIHFDAGQDFDLNVTASGTDGWAT